MLEFSLFTRTFLRSTSHTTYLTSRDSLINHIPKHVLLRDDASPCKSSFETRNANRPLCNRDVVHKFSVDLPKKHGRGGQSALRFARLREEKRHNYVRKVAELAVQNYISNDKVNVAGLIVRIGEALLFPFKIVSRGLASETSFHGVFEKSARDILLEQQLLIFLLEEKKC